MVLDENILRNVGGVYKNDLKCILDTYLTNDDSVNSATLLSSPYCSLDGLVALSSNIQLNHFSVLSLNCQSISSKFDQILLLVHELNHNGLEFGAICLQESWLGEDADLSLYQIQNYICISQGKYSSNHAGLIIYIHVGITFINYTIPVKPTDWECLIIKIVNDNNNKDVYLCNIYRPPRDNYSKESILKFMRDLNRLIEPFKQSNSYILLIGDFNIDLLKINDWPHFKDYFMNMISHGLLPTITLPTRLTDNSASLIDNIFSSFSNLQMLHSSGILISDISDHFPCYYFTNCNVKLKKVKKNIQCREFNHENMTNLYNDLDSVDIFSMLNNNINSDPNANYEILEKVITSLLDKHMPLRNVKFHKYKHKKTQWITKGIIKSIKFRDQLYKSLKESPRNSINFFNIKYNLTVYNRILKRSIREAKRNYYNSKFEKYKNDSKNTWATINNVLNKPSSKPFPEYITVKENRIVDKIVMANEFNKYFCKIGSNMAATIECDQNNLYTDYLNIPINTSFKLFIIDEIVIHNIIQNLNSKSSFGHDGISTNLLKFLEPLLTKSLALIVNQSIVTGIFPDKLKLAKIIPIHKNDSLHIINNYRPISLLPVISKVFEMVVYNQLYAYFVEHNYFSENQYGFRKLHSTEYAVLEIVDRVNLELDKGNRPLALYLDLSKAFDTLNFEILLEKLKYYGVHELSLNWFKSYLENRKQYVEIENSKSDITSTSLGVPQGSILGPLLFTIYVNDIHLSSTFFNVIQYADDTTLFSPMLNKHNLDMSSMVTNELNKVYKWLCANKLSLNIKKTKYMIFCRQGKKQHTLLNIKIKNTLVEQVQNFDFLGITLNQNLSWGSHIDKVSYKISRCIGILRKLRFYLPEFTLKSIYNSLLLPHLTYGILAWGGNTLHLWKLQKKAVRIIKNKKYNSHTDPIFKSLNYLKVDDIYELNVLKFYFNYCHLMVPSYFIKFNFSQRLDIHNYETRFKTK